MGFLYDSQLDAVERMFNGCILNGDTGTGKSRTALYYYFVKICGGSIQEKYLPMKSPKPLLIITTARKRDSLEWEDEMLPFLLTTDPDNKNSFLVTVDSWNNIKKYQDIVGYFIIFDEDRVVGDGAWVKAFLKMAKHNEWVILSATPGDAWKDYIPVFIANGFYKNKTDFAREHIVWKSFRGYREIDRYINTGRLLRLRRKILVDLIVERQAEQHHESVIVSYDQIAYRWIWKERKDPETGEPFINAAGVCNALRKVINLDKSRIEAVKRIAYRKRKAIIFYNFDYELEVLRNTDYGPGFKIAEMNGHKHQDIPDSPCWIYLVQYNAGAEAWNCISTDTIIFYSQNYSYRIMKQASGRIDRANTPFRDLYYYHIKCTAPIDLAIDRTLKNKKKFNEAKFVNF